MIVWGYRMWWMRRPSHAATDPAQTLCQSWLALPLGGRVVSLAISVALGLMMPVMGCSLALFVIIDWLRWRAASRLSLAKSTK